MLDVNTRATLKKRITGLYLRKRGPTGMYQPSNGWHRKLTYKIAYQGGGDKLILVAMTDGMATEEFSKGSLSLWIDEKNMVFMTKIEVAAFIDNTEDAFDLQTQQ